MEASKERSCKVEGCKRPYRAKGYCNIHFRKWRRGEMPKKPYYRICSTENCRAETFKGGMCKQHYEAWIASKHPQEAAAPEAPAATPEAVSAEA